MTLSLSLSLSSGGLLGFGYGFWSLVCWGFVGDWWFSDLVCWCGGGDFAMDFAMGFDWVARSVVRFDFAMNF